MSLKLFKNKIKMPELIVATAAIFTWANDANAFIKADLCYKKPAGCYTGKYFLIIFLAAMLFVTKKYVPKKYKVLVLLSSLVMLWPVILLGEYIGAHYLQQFNSTLFSF